MSIETYEELTGKRELYNLLEDGINYFATIPSRIPVSFF
jgi:hypothetical protein